MANATVATFSGRGIIWNRMKGNGTEALNIGWGTPSVTGSQSANVNLFTPATESRTAGTSSIVTTTQLGDTYKVIGTIVCAGGGKTITEAGLFDTPSLSSTATLAATLTSVATTMTLSAVITPTTGGNFYAQMNNETLLVTAANSTTLTIARSQLGSSANTSAAAAIGTSVTTGGDGGAGGWTSGQTASVLAANGGNMFLHADFAGIALSVNDSIAFTWTDTLT